VTTPRDSSFCLRVDHQSRCVRGYKLLPKHHEAMVYIAVIRTMTRRLARTEQGHFSFQTRSHLRDRRVADRAVRMPPVAKVFLHLEAALCRYA